MADNRGGNGLWYGRGPIQEAQINLIRKRCVERAVSLGKDQEVSLLIGSRFIHG